MPLGMPGDTKSACAACKQCFTDPNFVSQMYEDDGVKLTCTSGDACAISAMLPRMKSVSEEWKNTFSVRAYIGYRVGSMDGNGMRTTDPTKYDFNMLIFSTFYEDGSTHPQPRRQVMVGVNAGMIWRLLYSFPSKQLISNYKEPADGPKNSQMIQLQSISLLCRLSTT